MRKRALFIPENSIIPLIPQDPNTREPYKMKKWVPRSQTTCIINELQEIVWNNLRFDTNYTKPKLNQKNKGSTLPMSFDEKIQLLTQKKVEQRLKKRAMLYIKKDFIKKDSRMTWQNNRPWILLRNCLEINVSQ